MDFRESLLKNTLTLSRLTFASGLFPMSVGRFFLDSAASNVSLPPGTTLQRTKAMSLELYEVCKGDIPNKGAILYFPGGGYHLGSVHTHKRLASNLSEGSGMKSFVLVYRKAPEFHFPAPIDDARRAYLWLLEEGYEPKQIALGGDSAGGGLTLALLLDLKQRGLPLPSCAFVFSPWTDLTCSGKSITKNASIDPWLSPRAVKEWAASYLADADSNNPLASPLFGELSGLPPLFIQVGTNEILFDDSARLYEKAKLSGISVEYRVWEGMIHVFQAFDRIFPEAKKAIAEITNFIKKNTNIERELF